MLCVTEGLAEMESDIIIKEERNYISEEILCNLKATLPHGYNSKVIKFKEFSSSSYELIIRLDIRNEEDAQNWLRRFEENSSTCWRTLNTYPARTRLIFKKTFRCHHNTKPKPNAVPSQKHTKCPAKVMITIKPPWKKSKDMELKERPCEISLFLPHNHSLTSAAGLKYMKPTDKVDSTFKNLHREGHSSAWQSYKYDLEMERGDQYIAPSTSRASEVGNINKDSAATSALEILELEKSKNEALYEFQILVSNIIQSVHSYPTKFVPALKKLAQTGNGCKSKISLLTFIHNAGRTCGVLAMEQEKNLQGGKIIPVLPSAVARRKSHLGGIQLQQTGSPQKRALTSEHGYALLPGNKKDKKAPHCISTCFENNVSLG